MRFPFKRIPLEGFTYHGLKNALPNLMCLVCIHTFVGCYPIYNPSKRCVWCKGIPLLKCVQQFIRAFQILLLPSLAHLFVLFTWFISHTSKSMHGIIHLSAYRHWKQPNQSLNLSHASTHDSITLLISTCSIIRSVENPAQCMLLLHTTWCASRNLWYTYGWSSSKHGTVHKWRF